MRARRLDTPATLLELDADLCARELDWFWFEIQAKESTDTPFPTGLRNPAKVAIRAWYDERLRQGRYLLAAGRLFHIDSARDFRGDRAELAISATEFVGEPAEARPYQQACRPCRAFIAHDSMRRDEMGQAMGYTIRAEVALIEAGRLQVDDQLQVAGELYNIIDIDKTSDDGIVRGLWLERAT